MIIAIDGPAAAGKGTLARHLANYYNFAYLDTGLIYRAVGRKVIENGLNAEDVAAAEDAARALQASDLEQDGLRNDETAQAASKVSVVPGVRAALLVFQRDFAAHPPDGKSGAVLDGRDIGTVVCPDAQVKLFITASIEVRAARRVKELQQGGLAAIYSRVFEDMEERDARDSARAVAPLKPAKDAHNLDTSGLDADQVFRVALDLIQPPEA